MPGFGLLLGSNRFSCCVAFSRNSSKTTRPQRPEACLGSETGLLIRGSSYSASNMLEATAAAAADQGGATELSRYALAIHGGAGVINSTNRVWIQSALEGLKQSLEAGQEILAAGGSAMDAVVAAVMVMEKDPHFNAGVGSVMTASGQHELEASVMSGSDGQCGAVTLLKRVGHPILLAQQVMQHTPHIFLSGQEAEAFAERQGHTLVDNVSFTTQQRKEQWEKYRHEQELAAADEIIQAVHHTQTVGAVAIDAKGQLAAATSTGGRTNKWDGRIGDTPMIGAGTWADAHVAVSGTGVGEEFIRRAAAHDVAARVGYKGISLQQAMKEVVWDSFAPGDGGFVGVDSNYNVVMDFNSVGMYRGACDSSGRFETAVFQEGDDDHVDEGV